MPSIISSLRPATTNSGTVIGGYLLPLFPASQAATVRIDLPATGPAGQKEFPMIVRQPTDLDVSDRQAWVTLQIPYRLNLSLISSK